MRLLIADRSIAALRCAVMRRDRLPTARTTATSGPGTAQPHLPPRRRPGWRCDRRRLRLRSAAAADDAQGEAARARLAAAQISQVCVASARLGIHVGARVGCPGTDQCWLGLAATGRPAPERFCFKRVLVADVISQYSTVGAGLALGCACQSIDENYCPLVAGEWRCTGRTVCCSRNSRCCASWHRARKNVFLKE